MSGMSLCCPVCGSDNLRYSMRRSPGERVRALLGVHALRCRDCRLRFVARTWSPGELRFAKCPRCWRMDLSRWSIEDYHASLWKRLLLALGGRPHRCEYCRHNFVSFRKRREKYGERRSKQPRHEESRV